MPHMLRVAAREVRNPISGFVLVKPNDLHFHKAILRCESVAVILSVAPSLSIRPESQLHSIT